LPRAAIFVSGTGTNAEKILDHLQACPECPVDIVALVTDRPETSRAQAIAATYDLPLIANDIRAFYRAHGERRISLATPAGRDLRERWTAALQEDLAPCDLDFGIFAGFVPLTNLTAALPCLNVHPGDLTVQHNGARHLVGLHTVPAERAILLGLDSMRTSVIVAEPYTAGGGDMDSGPILGISDPVPIDLHGHSPDKLAATAARRPARRPVGGYRDVLEEVADANLELLKHLGDWTVFPPVVADFARGRFALDAAGELHYCVDQSATAVTTVTYHRDGTADPMPVGA
jgi:folate-dependent phosphoribosylglycinamide formyltransferase PurN